jgi:hypothetical protein
MKFIAPEDIIDRERYGTRRQAIRQRIIAHKRARRVSVGDRLTFLFEDRATVWYQAQEMLWVEHITAEEAIREELDVCNEILPGASELSVTLLIELQDQSRMADDLQRLIGIDEHVALEVGSDLRVPGRFEAGRQSDEKLSSVQYVRFPLDARAKAAISAGTPLALSVDHPNYCARTVLPEPVRASVAADLADAGSADTALKWVRDDA